MIIFFIILVLLIAFLEYFLSRYTLKRVSLKISTEKYLVEPDEPFCVKISLYNNSALPAFFLTAKCNMPGKAKLCENGRGKLDTYGNMGEYSIPCFLMPKQTVEFDVKIKVPERGLYRLTNYSVSAGDFIGIKTKSKEFRGSREFVVIPGRLEDADISFLSGGLMGEKSVRRNIHEDPVLTVGFREYTGREPQKSISWTRSLQSGRLMVKQYDHTTDRKLTLLFSSEGAGDKSIEYCYSLCRTVCEKLEKEQIPFSFYHSGCLQTSVGKLPLLKSGLGEQHLSRILEGLGRANSYTAEVSVDEMVNMVLKRDYDTNCCVLITPIKTEKDISALERLKARMGASVFVLDGQSENSEAKHHE